MTRLLILILLLAATALQGCGGSSYAQLRDEDELPELAALKQKTLALKNHTTLVPTVGLCPDDPTIRVAVHQLDQPGHRSVLVFLHGVFSDSSAWRFIAGDLAADHDVWLIDLPGCGESDKPDPDTLGPDGYTPGDLAARVLEAVTARLEARGGNDHLCIVGHSLGAMVALRMFADERVREAHSETLARVERMILSSPVDVELHRPDPFFKEIATISGLEIRIGSFLGMIRERVAAGTLDSVDDPATRAIRQEADARVSYLNDRPTRRAMQAMLSRAVTWKDGVRPDWDKNQAIVAGYANIRPPCLLLWGDRDEVLPIAMGYKLIVQLPHAELLPLPRVMHSPHLEQPTLTAQIIRQYCTDGSTPQIPGTNRVRPYMEAVGP